MLKFLYVPIGWKQCLLSTKDVLKFLYVQIAWNNEAEQFVYLHHNGRANPGISEESANMPGYDPQLWPQYTDYI